MIRYAILAALALSAPSPALAQQCYPWPMVLKLFAEKYGEVPTSVGLVKDDITFRVLASPDGGTWTAFMVNRQGVACPITSGTQWHPGNNPVKDEQG